MKPELLALRVPLPASGSPRRIELHWTGTIALAPPDPRRSVARLRFLGFVQKH